MNAWKFLFPPRAENVILPGLLDFYEKKHWFAQVKKNGSCAVIAVGPNHELVLSQRRGEPFKQYVPPAALRDAFRALPPGWHVFVGELMHAKTPHIKDTLYLYELLVWRGQSLNGTTYRTRWEMLFNALPWRDTDKGQGYFDLGGHNLWLAKNIEVGFGQMFRSLTAVEDEGLVLRDPDARLAPCLKASSNVDWMVKARRGTRNFGF